MLMALQAGAMPASAPSTARSSTDRRAEVKSTWKWAVATPFEVLPISIICSSVTASSMPLMPATAVSTMLSAIICERIMQGVAPMARRIPISMVRSFTVTIMMLLTPMAPASSVPMPTNHTSRFTPL